MILIWMLIFTRLLMTEIKAAETSGYYLSPPMSQILMEKTDGEVKLDIGNNTDSEVTIRLSVVDFGSMDESGGVAFLGKEGTEVERKYGLASWIVLPKDSLIIPARSKERVKILIVNKDSLSPGGHYGAVLATIEDSDVSSDKVNVKQSLASLIMVKKTGGEIVGLGLKDYELDGSWLLKPKEIKIRWENFGNVHLVPRGRVEIADSFGRRVATGTVNEDSKIILPETFRYYKDKIRWEKQWLWPGIYRATIFFRYTDNPSFEKNSFEFWYVGKIWLGLGIIVMTGIGWLLFKKLPDLLRKD